MTKKESSFKSIIQDQLQSLDDSDCHASAWKQAQKQQKHKLKNPWGGRGKGGRGLARRTYQPHDIIIDNVTLEYISNVNNATQSKLLLDASELKLLHGHVYGLIGRNGCGKSTLMRRIYSKNIPGFPCHLSCMYIPQEVFGFGLEDGSFPVFHEYDTQHDENTLNENRDDSNQSNGFEVTPMTIAKALQNSQQEQSEEANQTSIQLLEDKIDALDLSNEDSCVEMETLCEQISILEEEDEFSLKETEQLEHTIKKAFEMFSIPSSDWNTPTEELSGGMRKKVLLASAYLTNPDILLLDEPTNHLDIGGILQLRDLIESCKEQKTTVMIISHDVDLINDVCTDILHFWQTALFYCPGNYHNFLGVKQQTELHKLRQHNTLEKKRSSMIQSIQNLRERNAGGKGKHNNTKIDKKIKKVIANKTKKLERIGIEKNAHGHRWTAQNAGTGIKKGSINSVDSSTRRHLSHTQLLKSTETNTIPPPDKAVQFVFQDTNCTWNEPLIMAMDVGHGYEANFNTETSSHLENPLKTEGMLFDCLDLCINENSRTCILGNNGSGKSTLLRILAKLEHPKEGTIHHAHGLSIGYFSQYIADDLIQTALQANHPLTPLSLLQQLHPRMSEEKLRAELSSFGMHGAQVMTNIQYLSGGERCRLCLTMNMLQHPQVLILDEPTNHLDVESVNALLYGLKDWNGTVLLVSHDANFIRLLGGDCFVLMEKEGKLRRVPGGIDYFLEHYNLF